MYLRCSGRIVKVTGRSSLAIIHSMTYYDFVSNNTVESRWAALAKEIIARDLGILSASLILSALILVNAAIFLSILYFLKLLFG